MSTRVKRSGPKKAKPVFVGVDLHGHNHMLVVREAGGPVVLAQRQPNELELILAALQPFGDRVAGVAVESTFNTYWLLDGLEDAGYEVHLAHPPDLTDHRKRLKFADDKVDARLLAELLEEGRLPEGYIYPRAMRGVRDLFRRRMLLVQEQTTLLVSLHSLILRHEGTAPPPSRLKTLDTEEAVALVKEAPVQAQVRALKAVLASLSKSIRYLEREAMGSLTPDAVYHRIESIPGVGKILAAVIRLETGSLGRFASGGDFVSYCRLAPSVHLSNGIRKGEGQPKRGNRYLAWAFIEAAHFACRYCDQAKAYYTRKRKKRGAVVATKALAAKLARSVYAMWASGRDFDARRAFGPSAGAGEKVSAGVAA